MSTQPQEQHSVRSPGGILASAVPAVKGGRSYPLNPSQLRGYLAEDFGWRNEVYKQLVQDEITSTEANDFLWCGSNFRGIEVCSEDITHSRSIPVTCHKRYCPECARRESARLVANHTPQIKAIVDESTNKSYRLRRIELTTDIDVFDPEIEAKMKLAIVAVNQFFDYYCGAKLSESQRHRWSERSHKGYTGEGLMFTIEFGESGRKLHFHCLFFGRFIEKYHSSKVWKHFSGCEITYVKHVSKTEPGIREALKYVSKNIKPKTDPKTGEILPTLDNPRLVARIAKILHGSRRVFCRGEFRGLEDDISEPGEDLGETICKQCAAATAIVSIEIWAEWHYQKYLAAIRAQLDLKPGNKSATDIGSDSDPPGSGSGPPPESSSQAAINALNEVMNGWNKGSKQ